MPFFLTRFNVQLTLFRLCSHACMLNNNIIISNDKHVVVGICLFINIFKLLLYIEIPDLKIIAIPSQDNFREMYISTHRYTTHNIPIVVNNIKS